MAEWNQPVCLTCWTAYAFGSERGWREPVRTREPQLERCCFCGAETRSGIYTRVDPLALTAARAWAEGEIALGWPRP